MLGVFNSAAFLTASQLAVAANATIEVRREDTSALASIFSDEAGTAGITNPSAFADTSGRFTFYAAGFERGYSVEVTSGAENFTLHNVPLGTAAQFDAGAFGKTLLTSATAAAARTLLDTETDKKAIYGLTFEPGTDATNDININIGGAMDATGVYRMALATALGKQSDVAWAVGGTTATPAGALDTGAVGNSDYHIWLIARSDTGVVDALFSLSSTAPTMPSNYDYKRLIGWFKRVGGTIVAFKTYEVNGGGLEFSWLSPTLDINLTNTLTNSRRTDAIKVPLNFSVLAKLNVAFNENGAANLHGWIYCPDQTDVAPSATAAPLGNISSTGEFLIDLTVRTSSTGTIAARLAAAGNNLYAVSTLGFTWARRN